MSNVKVVRNNYTVEPLYQWSRNQVLRVYGLSLARVPEVHFINQAMSRAIVRQATMDAAGVVTVDVPNSLLQKHYPITVYICGYNGQTFETHYKIKVPVKERAKPADYDLVNDQEVYSFNALENAVQNALHDLADAENRLANFETNLRQEIAAGDATVRAEQEERNADQDAAVGELDAVLRGLIGERAQVVMGSYVGTGTGGSSKPTSLTFPFAPKFVFIAAQDRAYTNYDDYEMMAVYGQMSSCAKSQNATDHTVTLAWVENKLEWYSKENTSSTIMNDVGHTYIYVAIG